MPPKSLASRDVGTKDSFADVPKVNRSASKWTKTDLGLLGVDYDYNVFDDIRIGVGDDDVPQGLLQSKRSILPLLQNGDTLNFCEVIESYAQRIESVDMEVLKNCQGNREIFKMLRNLNLVEFNSPYVSLATLLSRLRASTHTQIAFATPPRQTTIPQDPNRSGGSTSTSSSTESKPEPYAQNVATKFLEATCTTVADWMEEIEWVNPKAKLYLSPQYVTR